MPPSISATNSPTGQACLEIAIQPNASVTTIMSCHYSPILAAIRNLGNEVTTSIVFRGKRATKVATAAASVSHPENYCRSGDINKVTHHFMVSSSLRLADGISNATA
ncbi:MAG TPA: hypothetical protein VMT91_06080 [Anaerolineales bacterium]|nr:hypothetical protein [Anaerolineales bacterium]